MPDPTPHSRRVLAVLLPILALVAALPAVAGARTVHLRGMAYEFNNTDTHLAAATIRVVERPALKATTKADGTYDLAVPDRAKITPYITAPGYHSVYLQTFTTAGENLEHVNFQTPTEGVYNALATLLKVPVDAQGNPTQCAIVSTFSTKNVRDVSFDDFTGYGAHGVAGATALGTPSLPKATYFNENVIPDPKQTKSSSDGGVVWTDVPAGAYTIRATSPTTRFASFVATCAPGRVVNANPPWGLYELAKAIPAKVDARFSLATKRPLLSRLYVRKLPKRSTVTASCSGKRCPFKSKTFHPKSSALNVWASIRGKTKKMKPGQTLTLTIAAHPYNAKVLSWKLGSKHAPKTVTRCIPLGNEKPRKSC